MLRTMNWTTVFQALGSAVAIGYLGIAGALITWLGKQRLARRVRVGSATWERLTPHKTIHGEELWVPEVHFAVFNGLTMDVGIHDLSLDLREGKKVRDNLIAPHIGELPETIKAQHSVDIRLDGGAMHNFKEALRKGSDAEWAYRLHLVLGNGRSIQTSWAVLPEPEPAYTGRGSAGNNNPGPSREPDE
jgi:hypothetical protein